MVEVEVSRGLVLGDGGDDGHVASSPVGVEERVETARPGSDVPRKGEHEYHQEAARAERGGECLERQALLLGVGQHAADKHRELPQDEEAEDPEEGEVVPPLDVLEAYKGDLDRQEGAEGDEGAVDDGGAVGQLARGPQNKHVEREQVGDEDVAPPGRDHVEVGHRGSQPQGEGAPAHGAVKQVEREDHGKDGHGLVVVDAGVRARVVRGQGGEDPRRGEARAHIPPRDLLGEGPQHEGREGRHGGAHQDADGLDRDRE